MSISKLEDQIGGLASCYRSTLTSIDILLQDLNRLQTEKKLPDDEELTRSLDGLLVALHLGTLHFPTLKLNTHPVVVEDPCPMCGKARTP